MSSAWTPRRTARCGPIKPGETVLMVIGGGIELGGGGGFCAPTCKIDWSWRAICHVRRVFDGSEATTIRLCRRLDARIPADRQRLRLLAWLRERGSSRTERGAFFYADGDVRRRPLSRTWTHTGFCDRVICSGAIVASSRSETEMPSQRL